MPEEVKKSLPSRGIPSKESLWLEDIRKLRDDWKYHQNVRLEIDQILHIIFPKKYQEKYYETALKFMHSLLQKQVMRGADLGEFLRSSNFSKATFYNIILPRLKRVGMITTEREAFTEQASERKFYRKIVRPSTQFSIFFSHLAREYESIVETAKARSGTQKT
ncbi:TPA: hypothetical protein H1016_00615 [archaeon]|uniref:Uncharacterized protein n=1 Tax=Candidatus Naiadarchaeum limnaeum TaxID=2756139 RepID=A0A832UUP2_9ARCH|nr:hypothetical protein [Candidatus Naiadarchaeum limnaeum]